MKQLFLLFCAVALITLSGCSKDDETLDGTVWTAIFYEGEEDEYTETLTFSKSTVKIKDSDDDKVLEFQYTYKPPKVTISVQENGKTETVTGTVNGNKLTLANVDNETAVFTKK